MPGPAWGRAIGPGGEGKEPARGSVRGRLVKPDPTQPIFVPPRSGTVLDFLSVTHKLTSEQTEGTFYLFESVFDPGDANRLHVHRREDEIGYVLEGALEVRLRGQTLVLEAGGVARWTRRRTPGSRVTTGSTGWSDPPSAGHRPGAPRIAGRPCTSGR